MGKADQPSPRNIRQPMPISSRVRQGPTQLPSAAMPMPSRSRQGPTQQTLSRPARAQQGAPGHMRGAPRAMGSAVVLGEGAEAQARHRRVHAQPAQELERAPAGRSGRLSCSVPVAGTAQASADPGPASLGSRVHTRHKQRPDDSSESMQLLLQITSKCTVTETLMQCRLHVLSSIVSRLEPVASSMLAFLHGKM